MMRFKTSPRYLDRLNKKAVFVTFTDSSWHNEPTDSAEADYFGCTLRVSFPNSRRPDLLERFNTFCLELFATDQQGCYQQLDYPPFDQEYGTLAAAANAINAYIRSRPFTILRHERGKYQLLDPAGYDYSGEYLTLAEAKRACAGNFKLKT